MDFTPITMNVTIPLGIEWDNARRAFAIESRIVVKDMTGKEYVVIENGQATLYVDNVIFAQEGVCLMSRFKMAEMDPLLGGFFIDDNLPHDLRLCIDHFSQYVTPLQYAWKYRLFREYMPNQYDELMKKISGILIDYVKAGMFSTMETHDLYKCYAMFRQDPRFVEMAKAFAPSIRHQNYIDALDDLIHEIPAPEHYITLYETLEESCRVFITSTETRRYFDAEIVWN